MMIFVWLILGFALYYLFKDGGRADFNGKSRKNPVEILQLRYINGEIDDEAYKRALKILDN